MFFNVYPKAFHLIGYKQNLFFDPCKLYWKIIWDYNKLIILEFKGQLIVENVFFFSKPVFTLYFLKKLKKEKEVRNKWMNETAYLRC